MQAMPPQPPMQAMPYQPPMQAMPPMQGAYPQPVQGFGVPAAQTKNQLVYGIIATVLGAVGLIFSYASILGLLLGIMGLSQTVKIKKEITAGRLTGSATAPFVCNIIGIALNALCVVIWVLSMVFIIGFGIG